MYDGHQPHFPILERFSQLLLQLVFLYFLQACTSTPQPTQLPLSPPEQFSRSGAEPVPDRWWEQFQDPALNQAIEYALDSNFNLRSAWERYQASTAIVRQAKSNLFPNVDASVQSAFSRPEPDFVGGENIQLGLVSNYEADLWGNIQASIDAERFRTLADRQAYQAAAISVAGQLATAWYRWVSAKEQLRVVREQLATNQNILKLLNARFGNGQIRGVDILRQKQLIASSKQQMADLQSQVGILRNQLSVLMGRPPQSPFAFSQKNTQDKLPSLPPLPKTGIPAELIGRRPDIKAAFSQLKAADREVAVAITNRYPRLSIRSNASARANNFAEVLQGWAYSIAGNLVTPLFAAGRLKAEVDQSLSFKQQRAYEYAQAVIIALREVEDALVREEQQQAAVAQLKEQFSLAQQSSKQLRVQYFNGLSGYLDVLNALTQEQRLQRELIQTRQQLIESRTSLYRALAGSISDEADME